MFFIVAFLFSQLFLLLLVPKPHVCVNTFHFCFFVRNFFSYLILDSQIIFIYFLFKSFLFVFYLCKAMPPADASATSHKSF